MDVLHDQKSAQLPLPSHPTKGHSRSKFLIAVFVVTCLLTPFFYFPRPHLLFLPKAGSHADVSLSNYAQQARRLLSTNPLVDGHVDLAIFLRVSYKNKIYSSDFTEKFEKGGMGSQLDLPRLDAGGYGGAFWSAFYLCPKDIFDFSNEAYAPVVRATLEQIDVYRRLQSRYPHYFTAPTDARTAISNFHSEQRTLISPLAIEGLHQIGNSFSTLRLYHSLGVRYATLTWNCHNLYADASALTYISNFTTVKSKPYWGGLSLKGRQLVREMNRLGMIVDISHVSQDTMRDVLIGQHNYDAPHSHTLAEEDGQDHWTGSLAPPIYSHSSAYTLCPHPRNVPDDILWLVRRRNGVVMVNFSPDFISCTPAPPDSPSGIPPFYEANSTLSQVADHIMHIGALIGYAHVGLGSDFDGMEHGPKGLEDTGKMVDLVAELLKRGISESDLVGVVGGNVLRVWAEVDRVAAELQEGGMEPAEDAIGSGFD